MANIVQKIKGQEGQGCCIDLVQNAPNYQYDTLDLQNQSMMPSCPRKQTIRANHPKRSPTLRIPITKSICSSTTCPPCTGSQLTDRAPFGEHPKNGPEGPHHSVETLAAYLGVADLSSALFLKIACFASILPTFHPQWISQLTPTFLED